MTKKCRVIIHKIDAIVINRDKICSKLVPKFLLNMIRDHQIQILKMLQKRQISNRFRHHIFPNKLSIRQNLLEPYLPQTSLSKRKPLRVIYFIQIHL